MKDNCEVVGVMMSNLEALIQAAQYLEQNDHDEESTARKRTSRNRQKKPSSYSLARSRTTHNLLEKNRRAQLRDCLEVLRQHVPLPDKLTTLALLQSARKYIESLQQKEKDDDQLVIKLQNEQAYLLSRLVELGATGYVESIPSETTLINGTQDQSTSNILNTQIMVSPTLTPANSSEDKEEDESVVVDILTHESEDDNSSTTSGSDGGCTSSRHKYEVTV